MQIANGEIRCDWRDTCSAEVTHIGEKGYVYCAGHVGNRRGIERCRKLLVSERRALERGEKIASFDRKPTKPISLADEFLASL